MMRSRTEVRKPVLDFRLFVYGTLQRGGSAHARYCGRARLLAPARVRGALFEHEGGFPVLVVSARHVLATGTSNAIADADTRVTRALAPRLLTAIPPKPGRIEGEVLVFSSASIQLAALDRYEGYEPGRPSLFARVLLDLEVSGRGPSRAWAYVAGALMRPESLAPFGGRRWRPG